MKFRPFTFLLLILLLLAGVSAASYYFGYFDAFFAEKIDYSQSQEGEGPVARREVSKLVLPLKSAEGHEDDSGKELNEMEIPAAESSVTTDVEEQDGQEAEVAAAETETVAPVAEVSPEPTAKPQPKPESNKSAKSAAAASAGGDLKGVKISCRKKKAVINVAFSAAAGKVSWFNLESPRRLVVDIRGKWNNKVKSVYRVKNCPVSKVVLGEHPDKIRLVIYLDQKKFSAKFKPVVRKLENAISLELGF